jgi:phosphate transport system substrate-binding protein
MYPVVMSIFLGLLALAFVSSPSAQGSAATNLRVNGAGMASDQVDLWAKSFMKSNPDATVTVIGSSAGKGFQALLDGIAEIALMSRGINPGERNRAGEKGLRLMEKSIGRAAIAVITHPRNPVNELTLEQLHKLYSGEYDNWKAVGGPDQPVRCFSRRIPESGGAVFFWNQVMQQQAFGKNTVLTETWGAILKACSAAEDLPIGIMPSTRDFSSVKVLAIKKDDAGRPVLPREENVKNGSYPIVLNYSFAWDQRSESPSLLKFVEYCQTQGGGQ